MSDTMDFKDYYAALGVERAATPDEIKKAFRSLALKWHPDRHTGDAVADAETRFKEISEAYEVLSDEEKRRKYDALAERIRSGGTADPMQGSTHRMTPEEFEATFGGHGFSDFFTSVFGEDMARGFRRGTRHPRYEHRGADARAVLEIPLSLAVGGGERTFSVAARVACPTCGGAGFFRGEHVCPTCTGIGRVERAKEVTVKIPALVRAGQVLRLKGLGEPGAAGATPGDLLLEVAWAPDPLFEVDGDDLEAPLPVAPWELLDGCKVDVRTPTDHLTLTVPPGSRAGQKLRIRGQGLPRTGGGRGDLLARLTLALPETLTSEQRELLRRVGEQGTPVSGGLRS